MRKLTVFIVAKWLMVIVLIALAVPVQADGPSRKRKPKKQAEAVTMESLAELVRRAEQAAAAAQAEAQRARQQTEAMQQQLAQTTKELAALRQSLAESAPRAVASVVSCDPSLFATPLATARGTDSNTQSAFSQSGRDPQASGDPQLADRVATLEEQVEINTAQIEEQAQTKVESDSRMRVRLSGMVLINTFLNSADSSARSTPTRAPAPTDPLAQTGPNVGANLRQTIVGLTMEGPRLAGGRLSAQTEFDFYGTNGDVFRGNPLGALRLRTASTRLDWDRTSVTLGLRPVMISPRDPSSLAMAWYPALAGAGNLWQWRPQLIVEHRPRLSALGDSSELVLQGGLTTPFGETLESLPIEGALQYQGRVAFRHKFDTEQKLELGVAGLAGRRSFIMDRKETTYVVSSDWLIPLGGRMELSGEAYFGKANNLGEQSGLRADSYYALSGPIDNPSTVIRGIYAFGGWTQLSLKVRRDLDFNFALGIEDPRNRDVLSDRRNQTPYLKNQVASGNFIYQLRQNLLFSIEYRRLWTDYVTGSKRNDHYNLSIGYLF